MLKAIHRFADWLAAPAEGNSPADLLAHPAIRNMGERELADLPLGAIAKAKAVQSACPA